MAAARSYRFAGTVRVGPATTRVVGEFQGPDHVHEVVTSPDGVTVEVAFVAGDTFIRDRATGTWVHRPGADPSHVQDPREAFMVVARADDVSRAGRRFDFSLPPDVAGELVQTGLPGRVSSVHVTAISADAGLARVDFTLEAGTQRIEVAVDYSDIGSAPPVTVPVTA
jgi:hypothetical protein